MTVTEDAPQDTVQLPNYPETVVSEMAYNTVNSTVTLYFRRGDTLTPVSLAFDVPTRAWGCFDNAQRLYYSSPEFFVAMQHLLRHMAERTQRTKALIQEHSTAGDRHRRSKQRIAERLVQHARDVGWCDDYDTWAEANDGITRHKEYLVTAEFTVTAMNDDDAREQVTNSFRGMDANHVFAEEQ